jgi:hypothetical protein
MFVSYVILFLRGYSIVFQSSLFIGHMYLALAEKWVQHNSRILSVTSEHPHTPQETTQGITVKEARPVSQQILLNNLKREI